MAAVSNEIEVLASAKAKLAKQFSGNFDPRLDDIYIPPLGAEQETATKENSFPLLSEVATRFTATSLRSLLLLGNSGMGKTCLGLRFCKMIWEMVAEGEADLPLPLYIYLPQYKEQLQKGLLEQVLKDARLKEEERIIISEQTLLLILDGFDEISINHNVYQSQGWGKRGFNVKMLVSCRPEALLNKNPQALFEAGEQFGDERPHYQKLYLQTFNDIQIETYLDTYLKKKDAASIAENSSAKEEEEEESHHLSVKDYLSWLERLPSLKALVKTPFLLTVVARALPSIVRNLAKSDDGAVAQKQFTQNELFRYFLEDWFSRQAQRVKVQGLLNELSKDQVAAYMLAYAQNLASSRMGAEGQLDETPLKEAECLRPEFVEPVHDENLLKSYHHQDPALRQSRLFFNENEKGEKIPILETLQAIRSGCLLHTVGERFKFLHKSITEYLAARELMEGLLGNYDRYIETLLSENIEEGQGLNRVLLTKELEMIHRLAEAAKADSRFKQLLDDILIASKDIPGLNIAAANAITVLNYAGVDFTGRDLSEVQISGADLSLGIFGWVSFAGADLSGVNFRQAYLVSCNWRGANTSGIQFGEENYFKLPHAVTHVAAYHPNPNELYWLAGCGDGNIYRLNPNTGKQTACYAHSDNTGKQVSRHYQHKNSNTGDGPCVRAMAIYSPSHLLAVSYGNILEVCLWDLIQGKVFRKLVGHKKPVQCIAISPDGRFLVSGGDDITIKLWNLPEGTPAAALCSYSQHADPVWCAAFSPDGKFFSSGSKDQTVALWESPKGNVGPTLYGHKGYVHCLAFSPDSKFLVSGATDNALIFWKLPNGEKGPILRAHTNSVSCVAFSSDSAFLVSGSYDSTLRIWYLPEGRPGPVLCGHTGCVYCIAIAPDGKYIVSGDSDGTLKLWSVPQKDSRCILKEGHTESIICLSMNLDGSSLVSASRDKTLRLWKLPNGEEEFTWHAPCNFTWVSFTPDNNSIVCSLEDSTIKFFHLQKRIFWRLLESGHGDYSASLVAFAPDGSFFVTGSYNKTIRIWYLPEGRLGPIFGQESEPRCLAINSDSTLLVSGDGKNLRLWHLPEGRPRLSLSGHIVDICCIAFSPDGKFLVSGSRDSILILWNLSSLEQGGRPLCLGSYDEPLKQCIAINQDSTLLISGSYNKTLKLWALPSGKLLLVIPLDFAVSFITLHNMQLIVGGMDGELLSLHLHSSLSDMGFHHHFNWMHRGKAGLCLEGLQIEGALGFSSANQILSEQRGSVGKANPNLSARYQAWCQLFKPIMGTSSYEPVPSLVGIQQTGRSLHTITENSWVLSVARKMDDSGNSGGWFSFLIASASSPSNHGFLILEGIKNHRRFIIRAELIVDENTSHVDITLKPLDNLDMFKESAKNYEANQFEISAEVSNALLRNIRSDQQKPIQYNICGDENLFSAGFSFFSSVDAAIETHNCLSWCRKQIRLIGLEMPSQWYNFLITLPNDVTRPEAQNSSSSSSRGPAH